MSNFSLSQKQDLLTPGSSLRQALLEAMVSSSLIGQLVIDREYNIIYANTQIENLFGYKQEELLGMPVNRLIPIEITEKGDRFLLKHEKDPMNRQIGAGQDFYGWKKNGNTVAVEMALSPLKMENLNGILVMIAAIEERQFLSKMEGFDLAMEEFAYSMSHDMSANVRHIGAYAEFLKDKVDSLQDPEASKWLERIVSSSQRMQSMIGDILAFARISKSGMELASTDLNALVDQFHEVFELEFKEYGAILTRDALPTVNVSPTYIILLFQNLIDNALKYSDSSRALKIHISAVDLGDAFEIHVKDNAKGVEGNSIKRIFKMFQRSDVSGKIAGTGVGLAIAQKVVTLHGGTIAVDSKEGEGSDFYFTLKKDLKSLFVKPHG